MSSGLLIGVLLASISAGTTLLYATLGELVTERAGIVNLGLEGVMLVGAAVAYAVCALSGSPVLGVLGASAGAALFNAVFAYAVVMRGANQLAAGLTLMFMGFGVSALIGDSHIDDVITGLPAIPLQALLPAGTISPRLDMFALFIIPATASIRWLLFRTAWGLRLRAVGESPATAFAAGFNPRRLQFQALLLGGVFAGLAGAHLVLAVTMTWAEGMTGGRGFIAVALVMFARWKPWPALAGAVLFGAAEALQLQFQARGIDISPFLMNMLPYLLTLAVLALTGRRGSNAAPGYLGRNFGGAESP
jgi:simple sugar transport system permease protein